MTTDPIHDRLLAIVTSLPGAYEDRPWGSVHCKVAGKIFVGWGREEDGPYSVSFKADKDLQSMLVASEPRFSIAPYVGKHGWTKLAIGPKPDWTEITQFVVESYRLIAPKKLVKELDAKAGGTPPKKPPAAKKTVAKKTVAKKTIAKKAPAKKTAVAKR